MFSITQPRATPRQKVASTMPFQGTNEVTLPQALTPSQATVIENYFVEREFELARRRGSKKLASVAGSSPSKILKQWTEKFIILGYGTVLSVFNINDNTINTIKSNFAADMKDGLRWGNDFYSCNGRFGDKVYKTTLPTLDYNTQTTPISVGQVVTDSVTSATATVIANSSAGATGSLTLDNINGIFGANAITDPLGGTAISDGTVDYTNTAELSNAPKCEALNVFDNQLHAISTDSGASWVHAAKLNDFTVWAVGSNAGDPYIVKFERAGQATDMGNLQNTATGSESFGDVGVIYYKDGIYAFTNVVEDVGGTLTQTQKEFFQKIDAGGERGVISTKFGNFFGNENGEFLLRRDGTIKHLSEHFSESTIADLSAVDGSRVFLPEKDLMLVTLRNSASVNNITYWFDTKTLGQKKVSWGKITGWAINRFLLIGRTLYGASSTSPKVLELLPDDVWDDEGVDVYYDYKQPLNFGQIEALKDLGRFDIGGTLSAATSIRIEIDGIDEAGGDIISTGIDYTFSGSGAAGDLAEFGLAEWGEDAWGDLESGSDVNFKESTGWQKPNSYFKSFIIHISGNDKLQHTLSYISIRATEQRLQRKNTLTLN